MAMEPLKPEVMVRQVEGLAGDLRELTLARLLSRFVRFTNPVGMEVGKKSVPNWGTGIPTMPRVSPKWPLRRLLMLPANP